MTRYNIPDQKAIQATIEDRKITRGEAIALFKLSEREFRRTKKKLEGIALEPDAKKLRALIKNSRFLVNMYTYLYPAANEEDGRYGPGIPNTLDLIRREAGVSVRSLPKYFDPAKMFPCTYVPIPNVGVILLGAGLLSEDVALVSEREYAQIVVDKLVDDYRKTGRSFPGFEVKPITQDTIGQIVEAYAALRAELRGK